MIALSWVLVICRLCGLRWTTNSHGGKHFGCRRTADPRLHTDMDAFVDLLSESVAKRGLKIWVSAHFTWTAATHSKGQIPLHAGILYNRSLLPHTVVWNRYACLGPLSTDVLSTSVPTFHPWYESFEDCFRPDVWKCAAVWKCGCHETPHRAHRVEIKLKHPDDSAWVSTE